MEKPKARYPSTANLSSLKLAQIAVKALQDTGDIKSANNISNHVTGSMSVNEVYRYTKRYVTWIKI